MIHYASKKRVSKDGLENLRRIGYIEEVKDKRKQRIAYLTSLWKWLAELCVVGIAKIQNLLKV